MTDPKSQNLPQSPETVSRPLDAIVKEWRQVGIAEGIAPSKVDQYLLDRTDVPEEVKEFIRKHISEEQGAFPRAAESPVSPEAAPPQPDSAVTALPQEVSPQKAEIKGDVGMLDSRSEIETIKRDVIEPSETEVQMGAPEKAEDLPSTQPEPAETLPGEGTASQRVGDDPSAPMGPVTGVYGYAPSEAVARSADEIAEQGPVSDAKTWQAELIRRFIQMWGSFKGLFSGQ